jgi:hypothetical protein
MIRRFVYDSTLKEATMLVKSQPFPVVPEFGFLKRRCREV